VLHEDGSLDRDAMARLVFADAALRAKLNAIVHPRVGERMAELQRAVPDDSVVVFDVPLLAENNLAGGFDVVVVVDAPRHTQLDRLVRLRGMTKEQAAARIAAQASRPERLAVVGDTGFVIDNSGSLAELDRQVGDLWAELRRRAAQRRVNENQT
jgi:dephospho-CoA kinase